MQRLFFFRSSSSRLLARLRPTAAAHQRQPITTLHPNPRGPVPRPSTTLYLHNKTTKMSTSNNPPPTPAAPGAAETDTQAQSVANTSGITTESLRRTIVDKLEAQQVEIEDMSGGCGQMFQAMIVSPLFEKKNSLARHRLVNSALKTEIAAIHAWTPKCFTPEEWEKRQSQ